MWIAVLGSVKLFPNLEAALKGIFNRVLKNLRKASARFHREVRRDQGVLEKNAVAILAFFQKTSAAHTKVSHARSSCRHNLNDGAKGALRVTLRAVAKPRLAIEL